jgi:hypothetical protein
MAKYAERSGEETNKKQNDIVITLLPIFLIPPEKKNERKCEKRNIKKMYHSRERMEPKKDDVSYHTIYFYMAGRVYLAVLFCSYVKNNSKMRKNYENLKTILMI